jgi:hypothetical protein
MLSLAKRFADKPEVTSITTDYFLPEKMEEKNVTKQAPEINLPDQMEEYQLKQFAW